MSSNTHSDRNMDHLPVESFYVNDKFCPSVGQDLNISWSSGTGFVIESKYKPSLIRKSIAREACKRIKWSMASKTRQHCPVLQITTVNELVTVKFDTKSPTWSATRYREFVDAFSHLRPLKTRAKALWDEAQQVALNSRLKAPPKKSEVEFGNRTENEKHDWQNLEEMSSSNSRKRKGTEFSYPESTVEEEIEGEILPPSFKRRNPRQLSSSPEIQSLANEAPLKKIGQADNLQDEAMLVYPEGSPGAVTITNGDLARLMPGQFLNDSLIEFGLKFLLNNLERNNPDLANQIHIFNSFFYKKLSQAGPQQAYASVKKWTSKVDIFKKKYIIIPINEDAHWFLVVIYEPEHVLEATPTPKENSDSDASPQPLYKTKAGPIVRVKWEAIIDVVRKGISHVPLDLKNRASRSDGLPQSRSNPIEDKPGQSDAKARVNTKKATSLGTEGVFDRDERPNLSNITVPSLQQQEMNTNKSGEKNAASNTDMEGMQREDARKSSVEHPRTYIFTMDSLGLKHPDAIQRLARYLRMEAHDKKNVRGGSAIGKFCSMPVQPNFCDCGVYLLHFAETFFENPGDHCRMILAQRENCTFDDERQYAWKHAEVGQVREKMTRSIESLSAEWKETQGAKIQAQLGRLHEGGTDVDMSGSESDVEIIATLRSAKQDEPTHRECAS